MDSIDSDRGFGAPKYGYSVEQVPDKIRSSGQSFLPDLNLRGYCIPVFIYSSPARKISILKPVVIPDLSLGSYCVDVSCEGL